MRSFVFGGLPGRVLFGVGAIRNLREEVERLGAKRVLVLSTPGRAEMAHTIGRSLGGLVAGTFGEAAMHTPIEKVNAAREMAGSLGADCCVAIGGGSTIGFGKAIAATHGIAVLAVPTTYSGSEMTTIYGISEGRTKKTQRDPRVLPRTVIYDPQLTVGLSPQTSAASGMNAIAHCAEALYAHDGNPIVSLMAEEGIRALASSLPKIISDGNNLEERGNALYGAWLAGCTISTTSVALHHKLCHVLGGFGLPHAETHSVVLPHALAYNRPAAPEAMQRISRALGESDAPMGSWNLLKKLPLKANLADLGMQQTDIERAARIAVEAPYPNPRRVEYEPLLALLRSAYSGQAPRS
jgi:alcohol dehydrogenase class IV